MENNKNILKKQNGSVALIVLFSMVFMVSYMLIMYASNINREKTLTEQTEFIKDLYSPKGTNEEIYERAYANLREKNKKIYSQNVENSNTIELEEKAYGGEIDELKIYGSGYEYILPREYQEVEYIESTGTQWIDTGILGNDVGELYCGLDIVKIVNSNYASIVSANVDYLTLGTAAAINTVYTRMNWTYSNHVKIIKDQCNDFFIDRTNVKCNDNIVLIYSVEKLNSDKSGTIYLFNNSEKSRCSASRIYYLKINEVNTNVTLINLIPCYRKSDNVIGMYDTVEGKFYTNQGTGEFLKGENVYNYTKDGINSKSIGTLVDNVSDPNYGKYLVPIKITGENEQITTYNIYLEQPLRKYGDKIDYLDIKTKKVYRNVGFDGDENICELPETLIENVDVPEIKLYEDYGKIEILTENNVSKIDVKYMGYKINKIILPDEYQGVEYIESTGTQYIDTGYNITENFKYYVNVAITDTTTSTNVWPMIMGTQGLSNASDGKHYHLGYTPSTKTIQKKEYEINVFYNLEFSRVWNGEPCGSVYIFTTHCSNVPATASNITSKCKLKEAIIYDKNTEKRHFIPCYRKSDGVIGMYDTVEGKFYTNQGTGKFLKGPDKNWEE